MDKPIVFHGVVEPYDEDSGQARICQIDDSESGDKHLFVRIQSWDPECKHPAMESMRGKKVKITVELV